MKSDQDSSNMKGKGGFRAASFVYGTHGSWDSDQLQLGQP